MKQRCRSLRATLLAGLLLVNLLSLAQAGEDMTGSEQSAFSAAVLVVLPVFSVAASATPVVLPSIEASHTSTREQTIDRAALPTPPEALQVVEATRTVEGNHQVILQAVDADANDAGTDTDYRATLTWPAVEVDLTSVYKPGEIVHFAASRGGSGWLIRNAEQQVIGFLPNAAIQTQAFSEHWQ